MKQIVLFGVGKMAEVLLYSFRHHSDYEVAACTADRSYLTGDTWQNLPAVAFEEVEKYYRANSLVTKCTENGQVFWLRARNLSG